MRVFLLTLLLSISTIVTADSLIYSPAEARDLRIGEEIVEMTVILSTDRYELDRCTGTGKVGFYIAQREDNKKLSFFCGTSLNIGDKFTVLIEKGI